MNWDMRFAHAVARVWMLEGRLLDHARYDRMLEASTVAEALKVLGETEYGAALAALPAGEDYERALENELARAYAFVGSFAPEPRLVESWRSRQAFHNLKALLKGALRGEPVPASALSTDSAWTSERLEPLVAEAVKGGPAAAPIAAGLPPVPTRPPRLRTGGAVGERVSGPELGGFLADAAAAAVAAFRLRGGPEEIDYAVDLAYQNYLLALAKVKGAEFLRGYVTRWTDLTNVRSTLRFALSGRTAESLRRALLPGGEISPDRFVEALGPGGGADDALDALVSRLASTRYAALVAEGIRLYRQEGSLSGYEGLMEAHLQTYLKNPGQSLFSFAPVWAYLMAKEREVKSIRLILVGKSAGVSPVRLRERMAHVYA